MTVSHHPPGDMPTGYQAGDIGLARATECYTDHGYPKAPEAMKPADLAAFYGLRMHEPPYPLSPFARILDLAATVGRLIGRFLKP